MSTMQEPSAPTPASSAAAPEIRDNEPVISVRDLSKVFKLYRHPMDRLKESIHPLRKSYHQKFFALRDVNFQVGRGETLGIVGRNGSGKSTLLKIISGVLTPTSGECRVQGRVSAILELGTGFNPELSGLENVFFSGTLMGYAREEMERLLDPILAFADIGEFVHQPVKTYSSGMLVRLAFAVQTMVQSQIVIIDEALAVGDEAFQRKCLARLEKLRQDGCTLLFVSHSSHSVVALCSRALLLHKGHLLTQGPPKFVLSRYERLAHAAAEDMPGIAAEILAEGPAGAEEPEPPACSPEPGGTPPQAWDPELAATAGGAPDSPHWGQARFEPGLVPSSTLAYPVKGAEITDVRITTPQGAQVNILQHGEAYSYEYRVRFLADCEQVRFAMLFKIGQGVPLGGCLSHPRSDCLAFVPQGAEYLVRFGFRCLFVQGTYFCNAGVLGTTQGADNEYLHRIMDAAMFRVEQPADALTTPYVDFDFTPACTLLP